MLVSIISSVLALWLVAAVVVHTLRFLFASRIFLYGLAVAGLAIKFVAKKILLAVSWIISAVAALTIVFLSLGRQFFFNEDAKLLIAQKLSPKNLPHEKTFSLLIIGLMLELHERTDCGGL